jgi:N-acetylneuraminic acid mutarotase
MLVGETSIKKLSRILTAVLVALTLFSVFELSPIQAAENTESAWSSLSPMPTARGGFGVAVVGGKIYAIGGLNKNNATLNVVEEYNPQRNDWVTKTSMPTPRSGFAVATYDNKIYCIGGTIGSTGTGFIANNEVYNPATDRWETKSSMPTPRADLTASVVDGKIYLIGGKQYASTTPFFIETNLNEVYDPVADTWTEAASMPTGVQGYASAVVGKTIYIIGGSRQPSSLENTVLANKTQVYDTQSGIWTKAAELPRTNSYGAAVATTGFFAPQRIYLIGGFSDGQFSNNTEVYDPMTDSWSFTESMPTGRAYLSLVVIGDILFAVGGFDGTNWLSTNEQFVPLGYGKVPPIVEIVSPENRTYREVLLHFTVNRATSWIGYSLDDEANVTINAQVQLANLSHGAHNVRLYANDSAGNMGASRTVHFSVDTQSPIISILQPQNTSYGTTDIQLIFTVDENTTSLAYSLDGQEMKPIGGNLTIAALSKGAHRLKVYATDEVGNLGEQTVYFDVAQFPFLLLVAAITIVVIISSSGFIVFKRSKDFSAKKVASKSPKQE